jgi:hypothetical protein
LQRIAAAGGEAIVLTRPNRARAGRTTTSGRTSCPVGQAVLFTITATTGNPDQAQIAVLDSQDRDARPC